MLEIMGLWVAYPSHNPTFVVPPGNPIGNRDAQDIVYKKHGTKISFLLAWKGAEVGE
jgi:hypothetical protein